MQVGDRIERYEVEHLLGAGGAARVYAVRHVILGTHHALKVMREDHASVTEDVIREGCLQARLDPERVISVTDVLMVRGLPALLMPLVQGCTLREVLDAGPLPESEALAVFRAIVEAVGVAHAQHVVHCDLKPSNVLLDLHHGRVRVRVSDFGIALVTSQNTTGPRRASGTPAYGSPEQFDKRETVDARSDIWSLGVMLYELLTGSRPFRGDSLRVILQRVRSTTVDLGLVPETWREALAQVFVEATERPSSVDFWLQHPALAAPPPLHLETRIAAVVRDPRPLESSSFSAQSEANDPAKMTVSGFDTPNDSYTFTGPLDERLASQTMADALEPPRVFPVAHNAFIGRTEAKRILQARLETPGELVVVTGPPGVGKSRLASECVYAHREIWSGGAWRCDLSGARDEHDVFRAILNTLGLQWCETSDARSIGQTLDCLGRCCLVLDQAEAALPQLLHLLPTWRAAAPLLNLILTTRIAAHVEEATQVVLSPLSLTESRALFDARSEQVLSSDSPGLDDLLRILDGLPMAIELAASWSAETSPETMVHRIKDRVSLLTRAHTTESGEALTLEATLDLSWALLTDWEQAALGQLSVFRGSFCADALDEVLDLSAYPLASWPIHCVQSLVEHSLVQASGDERFILLAPIHHYAARKLEQQGGRAAAESRHGQWFALLGSPEALEALHHHGSPARWKRLRLDTPNLGVACQRAVLRNDAETALATMAALLVGLEDHGPLDEASHWLELVEQGLSLNPSDQARYNYWWLRLSCRRGWHSTLAERYPETLAMLRAQGLDTLALDLEVRTMLQRLCTEGSDAIQQELSRLELGCDNQSSTPLRAAFKMHRAKLMRQKGHQDDALNDNKIAGQLAESCGDRRLYGKTLHNLALIYGDRGDLRREVVLLRKALSIARETGNRMSEGNTLSVLAMVHHLQGQYKKAVQTYKEAVRCVRETGNRAAEPNIRLMYASTLHQIGQTEAAETQLALAETLASAQNDHLILGFIALRQSEMCLDAGAHSEAQRRAQEAAAFLDDRKDQWEGAMASIQLGELARLGGDLSSARTLLTSAVQTLARVGHPAEGSALGHLAMLEQDEGLPEQALKTLARAEPHLAAYRGSFVAHTLSLQRVRILGAQGRHEEASALLKQLAAYADRMRTGPEWLSTRQRQQTAAWLETHRQALLEAPDVPGD